MPNEAKTPIKIISEEVHKCLRCHKIIKNPNSIIHEMGPTCWKKSQSEKSKKLPLFIQEGYNATN